MLAVKDEGIYIGWCSNVRDSATLMLHPIA